MGWSTMNRSQFLVLMALDRRVTALAPKSCKKDEPLSSPYTPTQPSPLWKIPPFGGKGEGLGGGGKLRGISIADLIAP